MALSKKIELEWKILALAMLLFVAFAWPVQYFFINRLSATLVQSIDPSLEPLLRKRLQSAAGNEREALVASLERSRQWQALLPLIVREQRQAVLGFSFALFFFLLFLALWTLKGLTRPLKNLAVAVGKIGNGELAPVTVRSGGALGTVEKAVAQLQEELGVLRRQAQLQGMEKAWQDIARVMAHEIKNPLTPMRLTLDRMEEKALLGMALDAATLQIFISRINAQIDVLERLVNQFRSFSREPEASPANIDAGHEIRAVADDMAQKIHTQIDGSALIFADPYHLHQVFLNILKNAVEAGANRMQVSIHSRDGRAQIRLQDNGSGLPADQLERAWLPYVSFKKGGTGLGLPVVRNLVEAMGGTVELHNGSDFGMHGACVILTIPLANKGDERNG